MVIQSDKSGFQHPAPSDITPESIYQARRDIIHRLAAGSAGLALAAWGVREAHAQTLRAGQHGLGAVQRAWRSPTAHREAETAKAHRG